MANYAEKLQDVRWTIKKTEILLRDNFSCTKCGAKSGKMQVHHEKYIGEPWDCPSEFLKTLCSVCHEKEHGIKEPRIELKPPIQVGEIFNISDKWGLDKKEIVFTLQEKSERIVKLESDKIELMEQLKDPVQDDEKILIMIIEIDTQLKNLRS